MDSSRYDAPRGFVDRFRVESRLGRGGMGDVYKAYDTVLQRTVAVKTLTPGSADAQAVQRLLREARACARLAHPGIVTIHDVLESEGSVYIVMEHLPGASLELLHQFPRLSSFEAKIGIVIRILDALHYAHGRGVIHRDIKPRNVQVLPDGSVKLLDFGVAHVAGVDALTATGTVTGTAHYASPEQLRSEESGAGTDVYSTGILAYEILTRRRPFDADSVAAVLAKVLHDPLPPMATSWSETFSDIEHIVQRAAAKRVQDRYASAEDMKNALTAFLATSRHAIVTKQAEVQATTERVIIEAKSLIASGRMAEAMPLLTSVLRNNPDAEEARTLLEAGEGASAIVTAPPAAPAASQTGSASTVLIGADPLAALSRSVGDAASARPTAALAAEETVAARRPRWSRARLCAAAAAALVVVVSALLVGPSWFSPESAGVESASGPTVPLTAAASAAFPVLGIEGPGAASEELSPLASNAEMRGNDGQPAAAPAVASTGAVGLPAPESRGPEREGVRPPEREFAPAAAAAPSSPGAAEPVPAVPVEPDVPAVPTFAARAKDMYYAAGQTPVSSSGSAGAPSSTAAGGDTPRAGIRYRIFQRGDAGNVVEVDPDTMFHSGDRIRFAFEPNVDGFLYVIQRGSTGRWSVLLPHPSINEGRNAVTRFGEVTIPPEGWFRFDDNPGAEQVFVYLSREPMDRLPWGGGPVVSAQSVDQPTMIELANSVRSRDLVFEKDDAPGSSDQAAYIVHRDDLGSAVAWTVELHHR